MFTANKLTQFPKTLEAGNQENTISVKFVEYREQCTSAEGA